MNTEMFIFPVKPGYDAPNLDNRKTEKTDSSSFGTILQDMKTSHDGEVQQSGMESKKSSPDGMNLLEDAIQFFTNASGNKDIPQDLKTELQKITSLLKTIKVDFTAGNLTAKDAGGKLMAMLNQLKALLTSHGLAFSKADLKEILDDFKKKFGTDPMTFIHAVVQSMTPLMVTNNHEQTGKDQVNQKSETTVKSTSGAQPEEKPQNTVSHTKLVINKTEPKKISLTVSPTVTKKDAVLNAGEKPTETHHSKSNQWVSGAPVHKIQQFLMHSAPKPQPAGAQIVNQVREIISKGYLKPLPEGGLELTIKLHPANLGTVQVVLSQTASGLQATLTAQSQMTKDLLQSQLSQLKQSFATLGINVQKIDVGQFNQQLPQQNPSQFNGQAFQQSGGQARDEQRQGKDDSRKIETDFYDIEPETSFDEWLREGGIIQ